MGHVEGLYVDEKDKTQAEFSERLAIHPKYQPKNAANEEFIIDYVDGTGAGILETLF